MSVDLDPDPLFRSLFGGPVVKNDGSFRFEDLAPGTYELQVALNPAGKGRNPVSRVYRLQLEESVLDFQRVVSEETATVKIRASSALSQGFASGRLTARAEHGFLERVVRLYPPGRRRNHGTWEISDSVFNASGSFHYNSAFTLELEAGEWELALNIAGFEPWSMRMAAQGALELNARLEPLAGRAVSAAISTTTLLVEARPSGEPLQQWFELIHRHQPYTPVYHTSPSTAHLPEGTYDFRISTAGTAEKVLREVEVQSSPDPLVLKPELKLSLIHI